MKRILLSCRWFVLVAAVSVAARHPALAQPPADAAKRVAEIERQLEELQKKLAELKSEKSATPVTQKAIELADMSTWKSVRGAAVSNNGEWFACRVGPAEGDGEIIVKQVKGTKEYKFPAGGGGGARGLPAAFAGLFGSPLSFSHDSKWFLFTVSASARPALPGVGGAATGPPASATTKTVLLNLVSGEKVEYDGIRRSAFSGEASTHLALHKNPVSATPTDSNALPAGTPPQIAAMLGRTVAPDRSGGSDLILRELANGSELTLGSVSEFSFDKKGRVLLVCLDSPGQTGNGIQRRTLASGVQVSLESGKAIYSRLAWSSDGEACTCLKSVDDKDFEGKLSSVVAFKNVAAATPEKVVYDPTKDTAFPKGMTISMNYTPHWSEEQTSLYFGIQELKKKGEGAAAPAAPPGAPDRGRNDADFEWQQPGPRRVPPGATGASAAPPPTDKPDLVLWHWKDSRLQSMQQVQAATDRNFSYLCVYHPKERKCIRLADDALKMVAPPTKGSWAIGRDVRPYQLMASLDGRMHQDVYAIDTTSGKKTKVLSQLRWFMGPSPDGQHFLYFEDGHYFTYELATAKSYKITGETPTSFVDTEDDHNVHKPPTPNLGFSKDGQWVLISDNWDIWKVPVHGGPGVNLTVDGKKNGVRHQSRLRFDPEEKGADLSVPQYFTILGERTKKAGIARLDPNKVGTTRLLWDDAVFGGFTKPKNSDLVFFTRETHKDPTDWYVADNSFAKPTRLTTAFPEQEKYLWSAGAKLVDYTSKNGDKLQAALFLPANYKQGQSYPTIVYIYEHLSDGLNRYTAPTANGFNKAYYTSHGYAVLMPDINYKINDPGMSAVACVLPAVDAAVATGVVDKSRIGLHGHSWGGYQTAFLVTQTNMFKAAVAGAPLTNLISMYSSIYWNSGSANQPIFESSQGRFTSGYLDNLEAYMRNSPVFHAKKVQTPLIILHNDKDGAVDFNQGVEYFNTLRRLQKPVVMIQYKGENHGVVKPANRRDYTVRMKEFFDHYLLGKPAPAWLKDGISHLQMDEHLKSRPTKGGG